MSLVGTRPPTMDEWEKKDLIDMILVHIEKNIVSSTYHRNAFHSDIVITAS